MKKRPVISTLDPLVHNVIERMARRADAGTIKYKGTMQDAHKRFDEWIVDTQEELMDAVVYLEKVRQDFLKALEDLKKTTD